MSNNEKETIKATKLLEGLLAVKEAASLYTPPTWFRARVGICSNLDKWEGMYQCKIDYNASFYLDLFFEGWGEWSGCNVFPVPSCEEGLSAETMYMSCRNAWTGEYGAARLRLLDYLIQRVEALGDSEIGFGEEV